MAKSHRKNYVQFAEWVMGIVQIIEEDPNQYYWCYKAVSGMLYDLQPIYSGYTSLAAIKQFNGRTTKMTREHYHSRTRMSHMILEQALGGDPIDQIVTTVKKAVSVHYTTKEENQKLVQYQNVDDYDWEKAYEAAEIQLVPYKGVKTWYQIDGIRYYKTKKELMAILKVGEFKLKRMIEDSGEEYDIS